VEAKEVNLYISVGLSQYIREKVNIPPEVRCSRNIFHASIVYREFSVRTYAPAAVAAYVSMRDD
jgi:hypothetical protein